MESGRRLSPLFECVPNFSEGRDPRKISAIAAAIERIPGINVLHLTSDVDHNRSVITFAGPAQAVVDAAVSAAAAASQLIDLTQHQGVHPRLGALDVLPFVPLQNATLADAVELAHQAGERIWRELGIPVYYYEAAALQAHRRRLEDVRRGEFELLRAESLASSAKAPDLGGPALHPTAGAVIVGARKILIAYNIVLRTPDVALARQIARAIRASSGGLPHVKAIGLPLESRGLAQVSMNLTDYEQTPLHVVFAEVARLAALEGVEIEESELIGLLPRKAMEMAFADSLRMANFESGSVIETRLAQAPGSLPVS